MGYLETNAKIFPHFCTNLCSSAMQLYAMQLCIYNYETILELGVKGRDHGLQS